MIRLHAMALLVFGCAAWGCGRGEPRSDRQQGEPFLRCAEPYDDGGKERFRLPPLTVERDGYDVTVEGLSRGVVVLGLLAGINEPTGENLGNVDFFLDQFKAAGVQAILIPGGLGFPEEHLAAILDRLAQAPVPILACPGALESFDLFRKVVAKKREKYPQILDMTRVRRVRIGNVTIVSLPGYAKPFYLRAGARGCAYNETDLKETVALFEKDRTNLLLSPAPPRGTGDMAVDRGRGDINMGDRALAGLLASHGLRFGLFGYAYESGGHATLMDGATAIPEAVWRESLYLQAGAAEAVPMTLIGGGRSAGMAEVVEISGDRARFRTIFAPDAAGSPVP